MILNQIALNPTVHYQNLAQHIQQQLPTLLVPVFELDPASAARPTEEQPLDHEKSSEKVELHTLTNYQPWLKHLYRQWQQQLTRTFAPFPIQQNPIEPEHWNPDNTARLINTLSLAYSGCLIHKFKQDPITAIDQITLAWREAWENYYHDLMQQKVPTATCEAAENTARFFQQYWLESWLNIAELQNTLPSNPSGHTP